MSTAPQPGDSQGTSRLRRRIVFELSVEQLPLLDQAEARHGSKRAALLAALEAQALVDELQTNVAELERALAEQASTATSDAADAKKALAKLERDVKAAREQRKKQSSIAATDNTAETAGLRREIALLEKALDEHDDDMLELDERVVSELYCARCNNWIDTDGWVWERSDGGGRYAYHDACGDHAPGLLGTSSWLAYRSP